jgi:hypothetical protein
MLWAMDYGGGLLPPCPSIGKGLRRQGCFAANWWSPDGMATFHSEFLIALEPSAWLQFAVKQATNFFFSDPPERSLPEGGN